MAHEKPVDQTGPVCPHCKTKPMLHYAIVDEIADNKDVFKIVYCDDCFCILSMAFVGNLNAVRKRATEEQRTKVSIANGLDFSKIPPHLRRLKQ